MPYTDHAPRSLDWARLLWADIDRAIDDRDPAADELLHKFAEHEGWKHFNFADGTMFTSGEQWRESPRPWGAGIAAGEPLTAAAERHERERVIPTRHITGRADEAETETPATSQDALNALAYARKISLCLSECRRPDINSASKQIAEQSLQDKLAFFDKHQGWRLVQDEDGTNYTSFADFIHRGLGVAQ